MSGIVMFMMFALLLPALVPCFLVGSLLYLPNVKPEQAQQPTPCGCGR